MGRPRKNRVGEYAAALSEELSYHLQQEITKSVVAAQDAYRVEIEELRQEIRRLARQVDALSRKPRSRTNVGKWVPGGPGRPPKDAEDRIAAFEARSERAKVTKKPRSKRKSSDGN